MPTDIDLKHAAKVGDIIQLKAFINDGGDLNTIMAPGTAANVTTIRTAESNGTGNKR